MNVRTLLAVLATVAPVTALADAYTDALAEIERNSPRLRALAQNRDADIAATRTGQTLADPEVEVGYLWGFKGGPDRKDLAVSQEFDLATLSGAKGRVAAGQRAEADAAYAEARREVMLEARLALIDLAACRASEDILRRRQAQGHRIVEVSQRMNQTGQMSLIDLNKTRLSDAENDNALRLAELATRKAEMTVQTLNGGVPVTFVCSEMPQTALPADFGAWVDQAVATDPSVQALRSTAAVNASEVGLAKAGNLPTFTLGYSGEFITDGTLNGAKLGVTVPLWGNRGSVRAAKAREAATRLQIEDASLAKRAELELAYEEARSLAMLEVVYAEAVAQADNSALLSRALEMGEMSIHEYLVESDYTYDVEQRLLDIRRQYAEAVARLYAR